MVNSEVKVIRSRLFRYLVLISGVFFLIATGPETRPAHAGFQIDCDASAKAYKQQGIPCWCEGGRIACNRSSGGGSYTSSSKKKGLSSANKMKLQMLQGVMDSFANAFVKWINSPSTPSSGPSPQQIAAEKEQQERAYAEWQARVQKQIGEMETQYARMEQQEIGKSKARLLAGMKGMGQTPSDRPSTAMQQLQIASCKAYWEKKAVEATMAGDENNGVLYGRYAKDPDAAAMTECARAMPQPPMPSLSDEFRVGLFETVIEELNERFPMLEQAKKRQQETEGFVAERQEKVDELKETNDRAATPQEKKESYDLLLAAMKELEDATSQKKEADAGVVKIELEINALNEVGKMATTAKQ
ncbi:MAG: hypothetical protein A4E64_00630 [Syntrophorhabdus sp. PtaU1.Bin058]|nr:MAG: hypothetical protein A4E64_00630 [Syntrophorhabdus sp. PtaU1.Bin058]